MNYEKKEAKSHEDVGHTLTYEDLPNGRIYWHCRSCGMQGSFIEEVA